VKRASAVNEKLRYVVVLLTLNTLALTAIVAPGSGLQSLSSQAASPPKPQVLSASETVTPATKDNTARAAEAIVAGKPQRVVVESLGIDLPVSDGSFDEAAGEWTLGYDRAYFATPTVLANESYGSTLIYAHNLEGLFAPLHRIAPGATLAVYTDNGLIFRYTFLSSVDVAPGAVQFIDSDGPPQVVLQTCTGNWSERRSLFTFAFEGVERV